MKVKNVKAENFLSYSSFDLDIDQGLCLISGYNYDDQTANGAGKTSLIDSISFGIFGKIPRGLNVEDIVNDQAEKEPCLVQVTLEDNNREYVIERTRNPNSLKFYIDNVEATGKDLKETQETIEKALGISFNIFVNSVYFQQDPETNFVKASDNDKKEILTELLELEIFDDSYELTSKKIKELEDEKSKYLASEARNETFLSSIKSDISQYEQKKESFEIDKQTRINELRQRLTQFEFERDDKAIALELAKKAYIEPKESKEKLNKIALHYQTLRQKKAELQKLRKDQEYLGFQINDKKLQMEKQRCKTGQVCTECKQTVTQEHSTNIISRLQLETETLKQQYDAFGNPIGDIEKLGEQEKRLNELELKIKLELQNAQAQLNVINSAQAALNSTDQNIRNITSMISTVEAEQNSFDDLIAQKIVKQKEIIKEQTKIIEQKRNLEEELSKLLIAKDIFKKIKYYIFDTVVLELNDKANQYLQALFNTDVRIKFDTQSVTRKKEVKQKFSTVIYKDGLEKTFNSLSGGEKKRVEMATNFALSDLISNRSNKTFNIMLLDECFNGLCPEGRTRIVNLLDVLKGNRENIFIIDHFESIRSLIDNEIKVEKRNKISEIVEAA